MRMTLAGKGFRTRSFKLFLPTSGHVLVKTRITSGLSDAQPSCYDQTHRFKFKLTAILFAWHSHVFSWGTVSPLLHTSSLSGEFLPLVSSWRTAFRLNSALKCSLDPLLDMSESPLSLLLGPYYRRKISSGGGSARPSRCRARQCSCRPARSGSCRR